MTNIGDEIGEGEGIPDDVLAFVDNDGEAAERETPDDYWRVRGNWARHGRRLTAWVESWAAFPLKVTRVVDGVLVLPTVPPGTVALASLETDRRWERDGDGWIQSTGSPRHTLADVLHLEPKGVRCILRTREQDIALIREAIPGGTVREAFERVISTP